MEKQILTALVLMLTAGLLSPCFGQKGKALEEDESLRADVLIEAFFTRRVVDLDEMLKIHQIRVLVVPSRRTSGPLRGISISISRTPAGSRTPSLKGLNPNLPTIFNGKPRLSEWAGSSLWPRVFKSRP